MMFPRTDKELRATVVGARIVLAIAAALTAYGAFAPPSDAPALLPWDKAEHFLAFAAMMSVAILAFPRSRIWPIALCFSAGGALIELIQLTPWVGRDAEVGDWVADTCGVLAVCFGCWLVQVRLRCAARTSATE